MKSTPRFLLVLLATGLFCACAAPSKRAELARAAQGEANSALLNRVEMPQSQDPQAKSRPKDVTVRILLAENQKSARIKHSGKIYIYTLDLAKKYKISSSGTLAVKTLGGGKVQVGTLQSAKTIVIEPAGNTLLSWNNNSYSGKIFIIPAGKTFHLVEYVPLEMYLYGVLPYEMSYTWPLEALKAQAVAARTYTLKTLENVKNQHFDLYSDVRSQMYKGGGKQYDSVKKAVDQTRGEVLTYQDKLFFTYYHANCGGGTDDVRSWNPGTASIKPLSGASCKTDSHSKSYKWEMNLPRSKVENYAKTIGLSGTLKSIKIARKTDTGRATNLTVRTSKGSKTVPCGKFRLATGIRSCKITKLSVRKKDVHFEGKGYGHGVGMCQDGAHGMAKDGKNYEKILKNYYPGSEIQTIQ